jgi:N-methylhydantoinase B/oxoprolinase/acetone carboxylase alpha subunit
LKVNRFPLSLGSRVWVKTGGGGGYGPVGERDQSEIDSDLLNGYVTEEFYRN